MAKYEYSKYKIIIDPESKKTQGLRVGDVVRRQYFDNPNLIYSLMVVLDAGIDTIGGQESHYFIGALLEGDAPQNGELLDFVRVTSLIDTGRGGALYLTASDSDAPYMDVIDGLGFEYSLLNLTESFRTTSEFRFPIGDKVSNPEVLLVSYKIRASRETSATISIGYSDETDGTDTIELTTEWSYKLSAITIDYPEQYDRELTIAPALDTNDWCEVSNLNVVRLSSIATFSQATKARMGKISGIIDPVFGLLDGYGAYFQNLYATKNVNIAGTLTAGDEHGFASTFYVGKIHKNVIINSSGCSFTNSTLLTETSPVGIGNICQCANDTTLTVQTSDWREERIGQYYCFSIWVKATQGAVIVYQNEHQVGAFVVEEEDTWRRFSVSFKMQSSEETTTTIRLKGVQSSITLTAPQLEAGTKASQYQPTDDTLSYTEDYGAWFSKGGIGGTIQNPLLKLGDDGSISSRDGSFVINPDGTGQFAGGRFKWTKDEITLQGITIKWEDLDDDVQENIIDSASVISVQVFSTKGNSFSNGVIDTQLYAQVYKGDQDITSTLANGLFSWIRTSSDSVGDVVWNELHYGIGPTITITAEDVYRKALFECLVNIT